MPDLELALASADKVRAVGNRDALIKEFMKDGAAVSHEQIVLRIRQVTAPL